MTLPAFLFILVSAFAHAAWNWLGKRTSSSVAFFLVSNILGCLCLSPVLFFNARALPSLLGSAWRPLLITGIFQALYYTSLSNAYRSGELSIAYPIVRSASVLFVTAANFALGLGRQLGLPAIAGIVIVAAGILILPRERFRGFRLRELFSRTMLFAMAAAVGTMGYSLVDDHALRLLRPLLQPVSTTTETAILYSFAEGISTCTWLLLLLLLGKVLRTNQRQGALSGMKGQGGTAFLTGFAIFFSYTLVLMAMAFARNVSYVVAFRQMSVPIGVALGVIALKKPLRAPKIVGVCAVTVGLILVGVG